MLLCTPKMLTRPWCLLEAWEAHRHTIPVLPVRIAAVHGQPDFDQVAMHSLLSNMEVELEQHSTGAFAIIERHLAAQNATLHEFKTVLLQVTGLAAAAGDGDRVQAPLLKWDPCATDGLMIAATQDLVERLASLTGRAKLRWRQPSSPATKWGLYHRGRRNAFKFFISYYRAEAGGHARLLKTVLEAELGQGSVFLDASDATDLSKILASLATSEALVLCLTKRVLERPWVLVELHEAIVRKKPILCVHVVGGGYEFATATRYLANLEMELGRSDSDALANLRTLLKPSNVTVSELQALLAATIPSLIALPFDPTAADEHHLMRGFISELLKRAEVSEASRTTSSRHDPPPRRREIEIELDVPHHSPNRGV